MVPNGRSVVIKIDEVLPEGILWLVNEGNACEPDPKEVDLVESSTSVPALKLESDEYQHFKLVRSEAE